MHSINLKPKVARAATTIFHDWQNQSQPIPFTEVGNGEILGDVLQKIRDGERLHNMLSPFLLRKLYMRSAGINNLIQVAVNQPRLISNFIQELTELLSCFHQGQVHWQDIERRLREKEFPFPDIDMFPAASDIFSRQDEEIMSQIFWQLIGRNPRHPFEFEYSGRVVLSMSNGMRALGDFLTNGGTVEEFMSKLHDDPENRRLWYNFLIPLLVMDNVMTIYGQMVKDTLSNSIDGIELEVAKEVLIRYNILIETATLDTARDELIAQINSNRPNLGLFAELGAGLHQIGDARFNQQVLAGELITQWQLEG